MSSKTQNKDGGNYTKTYQDESHDVDEENGNCEIAEACWRGMSTKDDPIFINCTTQGFSRDGCYLDKKIARAKQIIDGEIDDIHFLPFYMSKTVKRKYGRTKQAGKNQIRRCVMALKRFQSCAVTLTLPAQTKKHGCTCCARIST